MTGVPEDICLKKRNEEDFKIFIDGFLLLLSCLRCLLAQTDRKEVSAGNRQYKKGNWQNAEIEYRKAQVKDSTSFAANYNLAGALYREGNFDEAAKSLGQIEGYCSRFRPVPLTIITTMATWPCRKRTGKPL